MDRLSDPPEGVTTRSTWPWIASGVILTVILGASAVLLWASRSRELQRQQVEVQDHAEWIRTAIQLRLESHEKLLLSLVHDRTLSEPNARAFSETLTEHAAAFPELINVVWVDPRLRVKQFAFEDASRRVMHARLSTEEAEESARETLAAETLRYGPPFRTPWDDPLFELWIPIKNEGLLLALFSCEDLLVEGTPWSLRDVYRFSLVSPDGERLAGRSDSRRARAQLVHSVPLPKPAGKSQLRLFREVRDPVTDPMILLLIAGMGLAMLVSGAHVRQLHRAAHQRASHTRLEDEASCLRSVVDCFPEGLVVSDREGRFLYFNAAARDLIGRGPAELAPVDWSTHFGFHRANQNELYPPAELPLARAMRGQRVREVELHVKNQAHPNGTPVRTSSNPLRDDLGEITGGVASFRDGTDEKEIKDELIEAWNQAVESSQAKSVFLSYMSHEIRTPMNAMMSELKHLTEEGALGDQHEASARVLREQSLHMISLLDDVLALSMLESGITKVLPAPTAPDEMLNEVLIRTKDTAKRLGISIQIDYRDSMPAMIETDPARLLQVLTNLVDLLLQLPGQQQLQVICQILGSPEDDGGAYLSLEFPECDPGVSQQELAGLYEAYARADAPTMLQFGANGLRLGISKRLSQMLGGDLLLRKDGSSTSVVLRIATGGLIHDEVEMRRARPEDPVTEFIPEDERPSNIIEIDELPESVRPSSVIDLESLADSAPSPCELDLDLLPESDRPSSVIALDNPDADEQVSTAEPPATGVEAPHESPSIPPPAEAQPKSSSSAP